MKTLAKLGAAALVLGLGLAAAPAHAQVGGYGFNPHANPRVGPAMPGGMNSFGTPMVETPILRVSLPHMWLADASLFIGNAQNAANVLAMEQSLNAQAPELLGSQARFLSESIQRALFSLSALQQNAEAQNPRAVPAIQGAVSQLVAARSRAAQVENAANAGVLGPAWEVTIRSALGHVRFAQQWMAHVSNAYGLPQFADIGPTAPRFGAGVRGQTNAGGGR